MFQPIINIIELDSRDARFQTGIGRYLDVLGAHMPINIRTLRVIFFRSPEFQELKITPDDNQISVYIPSGFPEHVVHSALLAFLIPRLRPMQNIIVKSNCLGCEALAYQIRSQIYCRIIGVLHCLPNMNPAGNVPNPFFNMDHVVLVCDAGRQYLSMVKNNRPFSVIYNGIDKPKIANNKPRDNVFRFIFANGLAAHKGFARIIDAIKMVAARHEIEVFVIGGGTADDKSMQQISDLPIKIIGRLDDMNEIAKYYEMADCALFASYSEACSFAGIEALAYNLPIVSSDVVGLREMFGNAALYVKTDAGGVLDTTEYATQMSRVITDHRMRTKMSVMGYARYLDKYTASRMVRDTVKLYNRLIGE